MERSILAGVSVAILCVAPFAHAQTEAVPIGDPYTDTVQLWGEIAASIEYLGHEFATAVELGQKALAPPSQLAAVTAPVSGQSAAADNEPAQQTPQRFIRYSVQSGDTLSRIAQMFSVSLDSLLSANNLAPNSVLHLGEQLIIPNPQAAPQLSVALATSRRPLAELTQNATSSVSEVDGGPVLPAAPTLNAADYVTQSELATSLLALSNSLATKFAADSTAVPQWVGADGNPSVPYAAVSNISNLYGATITNANLTASEIPNLSGSYLSLDGGTVNGTTTIATALGVGTSSSGTIFSVQGVANWTGATTTYYAAGGINLAAGCFAINGTCISGGGGGGSSASSTLLSDNNTFGGSNTFSQTIAGSITGNAGTVTDGVYTTTFNGLFDNRLSATTSLPNVTTLAGLSLPYSQLTGVPAFDTFAYPFAGNGTSTVLTFSSGLLSLASTTIGNGSQNGGLTISGGATTTGNLLVQGALTSAASSSLSVGNLATPAFQVLASSTNAATGLQLVSNWAGNGVQLNTISSDANENLNISSKGNGNAILDAPGSGYTGVEGNRLAVYNSEVVIQPAEASGATVPIIVQPSGSINVTAGTEVPTFKFTNTTNTHANSVVPIQRDFYIAPSTDAFTSYSTGNNFTDLATLGVLGAPITGNNGTTTNAYSELIGSSTPTTQLNASTTNSYGLAVWANGGAQNNYAAIFNGGNVGVGTRTPYSPLQVTGPNSASSTSAFAVVNSASTTVFSVFDGGNAELSGSLSQSSDERLKTNIQSLDASSSLSLIDELNPVTFNWIDPNQTTALQLGFIAQQVQQVFPNLVSTTSATALTPDGTLSLNYIGLISPIVSAIQQLSADITSIESTIAGFAQSFTTGTLNSQQDNTQELCVGSTCVTPAQFQAMVAASGQTASPDQGIGGGSSDASDATDTPPVIQINGDNPATVQVGDTYNDLGATITGPQQDLNLGINTFVNGSPMSPVEIDTSQAATDTIDYVATDQNGLTSTSTRTVIVEAPSIVPSDDASSTAATTTVATSTAS